MKLFKHGGVSKQGSHYEKPKHWGYVEIGRDGQVYLKRWYLWRCRWFSIRLHHFVGPDPDKDLHDHPWNFLSFPLVGEYKELTRLKNGIHVVKRVKWCSFHRSTDAHSVLSLSRPKGVWTLFFTGRETRRWGFWPPTGWEPFEVYLGL